MAERPGLDLNDDDLDIGDFADPKPKRRYSDDKEKLTSVAEQSGFSSRQPKKQRRRGRRSVYTQQKNVKMRPNMPDLFIDVSDELGMKDYELMEHALELVLQKHKLKELHDEFKEIVKGKTE